MLPLYYAVIFTSKLSQASAQTQEDYFASAKKMHELAALQPGFIDVDSARDEIGITVSYWASLEAIQSWRENIEHQLAQQQGREKFYDSYKVRIARVEREYEK